MNDCRELREMAERGWASAEFGLPETDRAEYARLASAVLRIALANEAVRGSLTYELNPGLETGPVRTGLFGPGTARNSGDEKVYLHTGFDSRNRAGVVIPERNQPKVLREFWDINDAMLREVEVSTRSVLGRLGAERLQDVVFPPARDRRNVALRTVRYIGALRAPVGEEVVNGHADLGLMTWHFYETHGGWLQGTPYRPELITAADSPERRAAVREMRAGLQPLVQGDQNLPFFLGANWQGFSGVPEDLRGLPACYHAGFRPDAAHEEVSRFAGAVTLGEEDRVSVVGFMHPSGDELLHGTYTPATIPQCRPAY